MAEQRSGRGRRILLTAAATVAITAGGVGLAVAGTTSHTPSSNSHAAGRGINEFGMTHAFFDGRTREFTYTKGFYCDTSVSSHASSRCEAGANYRKPPAKDFDPLYVTVPLGFNQKMNMIECKAKLICVDHPGTVDMSRLEPALKPLYPQLTDAQLTGALRNAQLPAHDHFIATAAGNHREWWDVKVIGVTSQKVFNQIRAHRSFHYIRGLLKNHDKAVVGPIDTNLFLYFGVNGH